MRFFKPFSRRPLLSRRGVRALSNGAEQPPEVRSKHRNVAEPLNGRRLSSTCDFSSRSRDVRFLSRRAFGHCQTVRSNRRNVAEPSERTPRKHFPHLASRSRDVCFLDERPLTRGNGAERVRKRCGTRSAVVGRKPADVSALAGTAQQVACARQEARRVLLRRERCQIRDNAGKPNYLSLREASRPPPRRSTKKATRLSASMDSDPSSDSCMQG